MVKEINAIKPMKINKTVITRSAACTAQQVYLLGTFNADDTPLLLSQASVCFIQGPPEGMIVGVMATEQRGTLFANRRFR
jgi:hypothetical protein